MTCWAEATPPQIRRGGPIQMWRHPVGLAHAFVLGAHFAVCGAVREFDNGTDWPPTQRYEACRECLTLTGVMREDSQPPPA